MIVEAKNMKTEELIGALVELDKQGKENRALTNAYKAELQARGISIMDDHNVKYVKFYGDAGSASITDSMSLEADRGRCMEHKGQGEYRDQVQV